MNFLQSTTKFFHYYKSLGEKAMAQVEDQQLFHQPNEDSNSIATIVKHLWGNMRSRWTDFLTTDGEKPWRERDAEFENDLQTREEVMALWTEGWDTFFKAMESVTEKDLETVIFIRNEGQTLQEAILRQLAHYPYHVGQIVHIAKELKNGPWESLSIPRKK
ncbi:MAG TPA: DUF1572 family protein [Saprospiraceae bacterium]|nr:DUF1572 family protein [Saprospiraceae bacterium]